jgi:hypothetical protein
MSLSREPVDAARTQATETPYSKDWAISAGGAFTSAATIGILNWLYQNSGFDLTSFSFWFVIPVGGIAAGMAAASGYFFIAKWTHTMPSRRFLIDSLLIAGGAWAVLQWLKYNGMTLQDGTPVRDLVDFWTWFKITTEKMSLNISMRGHSAAETGELGALGYVRQVIQFCGFAIGGWTMCSFLKGLPVCEPCRRYLKTRGLTGALQPDEFDRLLGRAELTLPGLVDKVKYVLGRKGLGGIGLESQNCLNCGQHWIAPQVWVGREQHPTRLPGYHAKPELVEALEAAVESKLALLTGRTLKAFKTLGQSR